MPSYCGGHATDVVGYAWNADEFCTPCIQEALGIVTPHTTRFGESMEDEIEAWVNEKGLQIHREDTNVVPQPIFNGEDAYDEDGRPRHCGRCHEPLIES
jgi:hypothetical protein